MHYRQLDGLRFIAVMAVILHHICPISKDFDSGEFGVNVFFVISGFLITEILIKQKANGTPAKEVLKTFFIRRILRIFPLYYLYIFICYLLVPDQTKEFSIWMITYCVNIWINLKNELAFWYFTHLWSLSLEEQFYLFWPFALLIIPLKNFKFFSILIIISALALRVFVSIQFSESKYFNYVMLPSALDAFGIGALLAYLKRFNLDQLQSFVKHSYLIPLVLVLYVLNEHFGTRLMQDVFGRFSHAFSAFILVGIAVTIEFKGILKSFLENRLIMYIGRISYGMYIYHLLVWGEFSVYFNAFIQKFEIMKSFNTLLPNRFLEFIFISICTIIISALSFELFEKQLLRLKKFVNYST